jgi:hypothetical protein
MAIAASWWQRLLLLMQKFLGRCEDGLRRVKSDIDKFVEWIIQCLEGNMPTVY